MEDAIPLADAAIAEDVPVSVLRQAAKRGIINAWRNGGVDYVSRAEVAVYLHHRGDVIPTLAEPWASASQAVSARYAGAYARLREQ